MTNEQFDAAQAVTGFLNEARKKMRAACAGIGEPCVELPMSEIRAFKDDDGNLHAIIGMDQLIYFIDGLLRRA